MLLEHKADPNRSVTADGWEKGRTPLYNAIENEAIEIAKLLIHAGANVNAMADNGRNPLMLAHTVNNTALIELLTQANATAPKREILKIQFMRCASNQQWDKLVAIEEKILSEYPKEFSILLNLAQAHYFTGGNYKEAFLYAEKALSLQSDNTSLNILFMSLIRLGQVRQVIDIFGRHKENFKPQKNLSDNIIANLIVAYCASNQLKEGIEVLSPYFGEVTESRHERGVMNFNIACMYALDNNIHEMLPYVIEALERQYTKEDFLKESDFAAYHEDELFLFVLDQDHKNTIELEEYTEDVESNTFKKIKIKAYYNNNSFSFEDEKHEVMYEKGTIGEEKKRTQERLYISKAQALVMYFMKLKKMEKEDKDMCFILKEDTSLDTEVKIHPPKDLSDNVDFLCGNKITMSGTDPIEFTTKAKVGDTIPDFINGKIPVMSKRFLDLLREAGVDTLQTFPVIIKSKKGDTVWKDYFAINLLKVIACGAFPASIFKEKGPSHGIFCELAIDAEKANEALLFRLEEHLPTIIIARSVAKYLVDNDPDEELIWEFNSIVQ